MGKPRVLLIGWDAADWRVIRPLMEQGRMPALSRLIQRGASGSIGTLRPAYSPMLWTSIATGRRPSAHGVLGFTEPLPGGEGVRPVSGLSRRCKAIWNILGQNGFRSLVTGWWPSHPAEPIDGAMVSNRFQIAGSASGPDWAVPAGAVWPVAMAEDLAGFRVHPHELEFDQVAPFVPGIDRIVPEEDPRLGVLMKILAETATIQSVATALIQSEPWDFAAVYFDGIDHFSHAFMRYHPPRLKWVKEEDFERFKHVVSVAYQFHDMMLDAMLRLAGEETTVILLSDHGFHSDHLRMPSPPLEPAGPAREHSDFGICVAAGPGIERGSHLLGANLLDICPTLLSLFGLPIGADMEGRPLIEILTDTHLEFIDSWEDISEDAGTPQAEPVIDPIENEAAMEQLIRLGYIEPLSPDGRQAARESARELRYNLAQSLVDEGRLEEAEVMFAELFARWPRELRFGVVLFQARYRLGWAAGIRALFEQIIEGKRSLAEDARTALEELRKATGPVEAEALHRHQRRLQRLYRQVLVSPTAVVQLEAMVCELEGDVSRAEEMVGDFLSEHAAGSDFVRYHGDLLSRLNRYSEAESEYRRALGIKAEDNVAHLGLIRTLLKQRRLFEASSEAMVLLEKRQHFPEAHYLLGEALHRMGQLKRAAEALEVARSQRPGYVAVYPRLARIYQRLGREEESAAVAEIGKRLVEKPLRRNEEKPVRGDLAELDLHFSEPTDAFEPGETICIVSGLPRSGTSLMMQMLEAGGIEAFADDSRQPDANNPHGYYERKEVARMRGEPVDWLCDAKGRAVKIIAPLLGHLPRGRNYRVILMMRDLDEVIASQSRMLQRLSEGERTTADPAALRRVYSRQLSTAAMLLRRRGIPSIAVRYRDCVEQPEKVALRLNRFLGRHGDTSPMSAVVDTKLYRERKR